MTMNFHLCMIEAAGIFGLRVKPSHPHAFVLARNKHRSIWIRSFLIKQPLRSYRSISGERCVNFSCLQRNSLAFFFFFLILLT